METSSLQFPQWWELKACDNYTQFLGTKMLTLVDDLKKIRTFLSKLEKMFNLESLSFSDSSFDNFKLATDLL